MIRGQPQRLVRCGEFFGPGGFPGCGEPDHQDQGGGTRALRDDGSSEPNHAWLKAHGVVPVQYGQGMAARTYPLEQVRDAFRELELGHTHGKIVLRP